ncbi:MAG TPA: DUF4388 domain-containing protein [Pyrinomonadaceae bacterium]|nr:DUF4388 domain-containing protein [Pyrinomonadaceae bacterium]
MNNGLRDGGMLGVIRELSAQGASGRLHISTGMTEGALFFARGQLVDARLGRLSGFQAINALVSVPDASYNFDPSVAPPVESSIAPNERLLLKDFFGIEVVGDEHSHADVVANWSEDGSAPEQVVPLAEVAEAYPDDQQLSANEDEEATLVRPKRVVAETRREPFVAEPRDERFAAEVGPTVAERRSERVFAAERDEQYVAEPERERFVAEPARGRIFAEPRAPLANPPGTRSRFLPALFVVLVTVLVAAAAVVLLNRLRKPDANPSVASAVQTAPHDDVAQQPQTQSQPEASTTKQPATRPSQPATQPTQQPTTQPAQQPDTQTTAAVPDLTGNWTVINTVEQTAYEPYRNMEIGFNVAINQAGRNFTGTGEKISENGRSLPAAGRTPIQVKGTIDGDKIQATFSENGSVRKTNGRFVWRIDRGSGGLTGTFISTAARTSGKSAAKKSL